VSTRRDEDARTAALESFLTERIAEGFVVESRTATQAIIVPRMRSIRLLARLRKHGSDRRQVISVNEHGVVTVSAAQPLRW
jgi:hypothetical protein